MRFAEEVDNAISKVCSSIQGSLMVVDEYKGLIIGVCCFCRFHLVWSSDLVLVCSVENMLCLLFSFSYYTLHHAYYTFMLTFVFVPLYNSC